LISHSNIAIKKLGLDSQIRYLQAQSAKRDSYQSDDSRMDHEADQESTAFRSLGKGDGIDV
jgi:hypothetical protein